MSKNVVATFAIPNEKGGPAYLRQTVPNLEAYADRIGASFICLNRCAEHERKPWPSLFYAKFAVYDAAYNQGFDRVLYVDADVLISTDAPNVFDKFAAGKVWAKKDVKPTRDKFIEWTRAIPDAPQIADDFPHVNAGVILTDVALLNKFTTWARQNVTDAYGAEQNLLNYWALCNPGVVDFLPDAFNEFGGPDGKPGSFFFHFCSPERKAAIANHANADRFWKVKQ